MTSPLHLIRSGAPSGPPLILLHGMATDLTLWDDLIPHLPQDLLLVRVDLPGHGQSPVSVQPGRIGGLIRSVEETLDHLEVRDAVVLGHGLGGLIAQGLAVKRLDMVRALILSATATKLVTRAYWNEIAARIRRDGHAALVQGPAATWLPPKATPTVATRLADHIRAQPIEGLAQAAEAIAGTDFYTSTASLRLPLLCVVGGQDRHVPPDLVRETAGLVPGSQFALVSRAGHLAMVDAPESYGEKVSEFLKTIGHGENLR